MKKVGTRIDAHVGSRLRLRRMLIGMSQERMGELLGLTFQQVQKYEKGTNRIGAGRLFQIARILDVPVQYFYDDLPDAGASPGAEPAAAAGVPAGFADSPQAPYMMPYVSSPEGLQLNRHFVRIADPRVRKRIVDLVKTLAGDEQDESKAG